MPHQCVNCGEIYKDTDRAILEGCRECEGKFFFYVKKERLQELKDSTVNLSKKERKEIEKDVMEIVGEKEVKDQPIVLDLESIRILKPGQYELDLVHLFKKEPLIYKLEDGKYIIDLPESFKKKFNK